MQNSNEEINSPANKSLSNSSNKEFNQSGIYETLIKRSTDNLKYSDLAKSEDIYELNNENKDSQYINISGIPNINKSLGEGSRDERINKSNLNKNKKGKKPGFFRLYWRIIKLSLQYKFLFLVANIGVIITAFTQTSIPLICGKILDSINKNDSNELFNLCYKFIFIALTTGIFGFFKGFCYDLLGSRVVRDLRLRLFEKLIYKDVEFYDSNRTGELVSRIGSDITVINNSSSEYFSLIIKNIITFFVSFGILFFLNSKLTLYILLVIPPIVISVMVFRRYFRRLSKDYQNSIADSSAIAAEIFGNIRVVKSFSTEKKECEKYFEKIDFSYTIAYKKGLISGLLTLIITIFANLAILFVLWIGGLEVLNGKMTSGELSSFILYTITLSSSVMSFGRVNQLINATAVSEKIFQLIDEENKIQEKKVIYDPENNNVYEISGDEISIHANENNLLKKYTEKKEYKMQDNSVYDKSNPQELSINPIIQTDSILNINLEQNKNILNSEEINQFSDSGRILFENGIKIKISGNISFNNVTFCYPSKSHVEILSKINLKIIPGEKIAIVGSSGSGKSTIVSLLQRFYDCTQGDILFDNINIKYFNIESFHQQIGFVSQEPTLFSGTIKENIIYGLRGISLNKNDIDKKNHYNHKLQPNIESNEFRQSKEEHLLEKIIYAIKLANAYEFIYDSKKFPDGLSTLVGERGVQLSGGQKQRIAIARALIKNPKILIFDEATSALDSESEYQVQQAINGLMAKGDTTMLIIAHRLSTIINCDRILVMKNGEIVEEGNHKQLLNLNGFYKTLIEKQIASFSNYDYDI